MGNGGGGVKTMPLPEFSKEQQSRFWKKVVKCDGCWKWTGAINHNGYGVWSVICGDKTKNFLAHRVSFHLTNGPVSGLVLHRCDVRDCVNPYHLFTGNHADNTHDAMSKNRLAVGERHGNSRLTKEIVLEVRRMHSAGHIQAEIHRRFNLSRPLVSDLVNRKKWRHLA